MPRPPLTAIVREVLWLALYTTIAGWLLSWLF